MVTTALVMLLGLVTKLRPVPTSLEIIPVVGWEHIPCADLKWKWTFDK
jgi:hypothetical protein